MTVPKNSRPAQGQRRLKPRHSMTAEDGVRDISPTKAPHGIPQLRWARGMPEGRREDKQLAWYRGEHAGIHSAYLTIKKAYPLAAAALLRAFRMTPKGNL